MIKFIIEIGLNHMGSEKTGLKLVKKAIRVKPWGISFQLAWEKYYDESKPWKKKLTLEFYKKIDIILKKNQIKFGLGIYDINAINFVSGINIDFWKIISTKFYNDNLIHKALKTRKPIFLSTGFASMKEIKKKSLKFKRVNFIHTALDKKISQNLNAIKTIKKETKKKEIAYGLHSNDHNVIPMALALDANPIFFYIRPDNKKKYPDHDHAVAINDLKKKINYWRKCKDILSDGKKNNLKIPKWVLE